MVTYVFNKGWIYVILIYKFTKDNYLLKNRNSQKLYAEYVNALPIIDFQNHISVSDIAKDRRFENLCELWLSSDPYKHRLMRICGVESTLPGYDAMGRLFAIGYLKGILDATESDHA